MTVTACVQVECVHALTGERAWGAPVSVLPWYVQRRRSVRCVVGLPVAVVVGYAPNASSSDRGSDLAV